MSEAKTPDDSTSDARTAGSKRPLCPSAPCAPGALLLGVVSAESRVEFLEQPVVVDERFVDIARQGRPPEKRFRFSAPCMERGCAQWSSGRCGVPGKVLSQLGTPAEPAALPPCRIRSRCRWFQQEGAQACAVCPEVITDMT